MTSVRFNGGKGVMSHLADLYWPGRWRRWDKHCQSAALTSAQKCRLRTKCARYGCCSDLMRYPWAHKVVVALAVVSVLCWERGPNLMEGYSDVEASCYGGVV